MSNKINERHLDEEFLNNLYTTDNPPTASDIGAVSINELATQIQSLIEQGVIEVSEPIYQIGTNVLETIVNNEYTMKRGQYDYLYLGMFMPKYDGLVQIKAQFKVSSSSGSFCIINQGGYTSRSVEVVMDEVSTLSQGAKYNSNEVSSAWSRNIGFSQTSYSTIAVETVVRKGVPVVFLAHGGSSSDTTIYCNSIKIYADEVR